MGQNCYLEEVNSFWKEKRGLGDGANPGNLEAPNKEEEEEDLLVQRFETAFLVMEHFCSACLAFPQILAIARNAGFSLPYKLQSWFFLGFQNSECLVGLNLGFM